MVDVRQTNEKLITRAENIVMEAIGCGRGIRKALAEADGDAKLAITKMLLKCDIETARNIYHEQRGVKQQFPLT